MNLLDHLLDKSVYLFDIYFGLDYLDLPNYPNRTRSPAKVRLANHRTEDKLLILAEANGQRRLENFHEHQDKNSKLYLVQLFL